MRMLQIASPAAATVNTSASGEVMRTVAPLSSIVINHISLTWSTFHNGPRLCKAFALRKSDWAETGCLAGGLYGNFQRKPLGAQQSPLRNRKFWRRFERKGIS